MIVVLDQTLALCRPVAEFKFDLDIAVRRVEILHRLPHPLAQSGNPSEFPEYYRGRFARTRNVVCSTGDQEQNW